MMRPIEPPIFGSKPNSIDQVGLSITPSSVMNSCTTILPMFSPVDCFCALPLRPARDRGLIDAVHDGCLEQAGPRPDRKARVDPSTHVDCSSACAIDRGDRAM